MCPNYGTGAFGTAANLPLGGDPRSLTLADVNGMATSTLLVAIYSFNSVSVIFKWSTGNSPALRGGGFAVASRHVPRGKLRAAKQSSFT